MTLLPQVLTVAVVVASAAFYAGAVMCERWKRGPVVDQRTYRAACRQATRLIKTGEASRARACITGICVWLQRQTQAGPPDERVRRASQLERWELAKAQLPSSADHAQGQLDGLLEDV